MSAAFDPVSLGIMWSRLINIAEECWITIWRTAFSLIIGEAQDFGCELFDPDAHSIAHSPRSMPVFNLTLPLVNWGEPFVTATATNINGPHLFNSSTSEFVAAAWERTICRRFKIRRGYAFVFRIEHRIRQNRDHSWRLGMTIMALSDFCNY